MALNFVVTEKKTLTPRITVFGVGGAGGNAVNNMIDQNLDGVDFVVANTDAQALQQSKAPVRIQLGVKATEGLGAGARPSVGASAAEETLTEIMDNLAGAHMCFITAGMGGGTGTGAAPIIAQAAREMGVLTVGVVTKPFAFEGAKRMRQAEEGVEALQKVVDTLIIIPNQNLFRLANERTTATDAFALADDVLYQGVKGVTDLMVRPGMINLDFADVRAVMDEMGKAMMGTGEATGEDRARKAAEKAIANPLLDEISLHGAKGVLINITGGHDLTLFELDEAANLIREKVDPDANIIVGSTLDDTMNGAIRVSVVATGIEAQPHAAEIPRRRLGEPLAAVAAPVEAEQAPAPTHEPYYEAPRAEAEMHHEPIYSAQETRFEPRPDMRSELRHEMRHEPRFEARTQQRGYHDEPAPQPTTQRDSHAPHSEPVQEEFSLDEVLGDEARNPRPTVVVRQHAAPQRPEYGFTAPQPGAQLNARRPGEPAPEVLERLRRVTEGAQRPAARPAPAPQPVAPPAPPATGSRFGLGSLINRMAGGAPEPAPRAQPAIQVNRALHQSYDDEAHHAASHEQVEIPAFLRRQVN